MTGKARGKEEEGMSRLQVQQDLQGEGMTSRGMSKKNVTGHYQMLDRDVK